MMNRVVLLALPLLIGGCGDARNDAAAELLRLDQAMRQHATEYKQYPTTLDLTRPASASNLPHRSERGVELRLLGATGDEYHATAQRGRWGCWMSVGPRRLPRPDCSPSGSPGGNSAAASAPSDVPSTGTVLPALTTPAAADSGSAPRPAPES